MKNSKIYLILIGIMFLWGLNVSALKVIVGNFPPITITALRVFTAGVSVFIILLFLKKIRLPSRKEWKYIIGGSILNVTGHHLFLGIGLNVTSAVNGGLILGLGPLLTALMAILFLGKKLTFVRTLGFIFGGIGVSLTVLAGDTSLSGMSIGDFYVFLAIVSQAISFIIISKAAKTLDPRLLTGYMLVIGSILLLLIGLWKEPEGLASLGNASVGMWSIFFASAIFATAVGHMLYNYAIGQTGPAEASIFLNLNTFLSILFAGIFLGERITSSHMLGLIFIVAGVIFGSGALEELMLKNRAKRNAA
ncbi:MULTISPECIES: DMT family transporter [Mesobacillus]|uniref:Drug/metabolite transporter (DMT)-like permease n=1 Tax=Mesobacillus stamsii TaxID=225347 RepID=A0ABU0FVN2_9BACI|nr:MULTISPECIES: DMT family transporter [Mesobacillus]MDQ0413977.1 drug/metabolite transporter (DMT)-like permease [Mesobacillus stamsii]